MKILVIGSRIPWPLKDGGAIATYHMLKSMAECGASVTYFSYNTKKHFLNEAGIAAHFGFCRVITSYLDAGTSATGALLALLRGQNYNLSRFHSEPANRQLATLLQEETFDLIHFEGLFAIPFLPVVKRYFKGPLVLRQHNVEYQIWERLAAAEGNLLKRWYLNHLAKGLKRAEEAALPQFDGIAAITKSDAAEFQKTSNKVPVWYYPAGMEISPDAGVNAKTHTVYHIGSMEWMPNVQGVEWFLNEVWPAVRNAVPDAEFHMAGRGLSAGDTRFSGAGVINHGEVADAAAFEAEYQICIVPLKSGSGLRMKTLSAMAAAKPVLTTSVGANGIDATNGTHWQVADGAGEWVNALVALLNDAGTCAKLGSNAREFVRQHYDQKQLTFGLLQHYEMLLKKFNSDT